MVSPLVGGNRRPHRTNAIRATALGQRGESRDDRSVQAVPPPPAVSSPALTLALVLGVLVDAARRGRGEHRRSSSGSKDFAGAQIVSQAYGQTLEAKGYKITYKDNIGPTETVYPLLKNGDIDLYGEFQGTFLTYLGGTPTGDTAETFKLLQDKLEGHRHRRGRPAPAVDVNGFYVLKYTAKKYNLKNVSRPDEGRRQADVRWAARVPRPDALPRCQVEAALRPAVQRGQEARRRRPDHRARARRRRHRRRPALHRQQRHRRTRCCSPTTRACSRRTTPCS